MICNILNCKCQFTEILNIYTCTFLGTVKGGISVTPTTVSLRERVFLTISGTWTPSTRPITLPPPYRD